MNAIARIQSDRSLPTLDMLPCLGYATGTTLRIAALGITHIDLGEAA
jgi:hypothetical protein